MKTTKEKIEVMQAFEEGKDIEFKWLFKADEPFRTWDLTDDPVWNWCDFDYRIKEESKSVLMTQRRLCELLAKGYGEFMVEDETETEVYPTYFYSKGNGDNPVADNVRIRPWGGDEWIRPTVDVHEGFFGTKGEEDDEDEKVYKVGEWGQAGWVFYDKGEYSDGWRYMEAAPDDLRVVGGKPTVDSTAPGYGGAVKRYIFGVHRASVGDSNQLVGTYTLVGYGEVNTENLVKAMGDNAYTSKSGSGTTPNYAARLCSILEYKHDGVVYTDWFLPSRDELDLMYENLKKNGTGQFADGYYYSSSESDAYDAWGQSFNSGYQDGYYSCSGSHVRPARCF